MCEERGVDCRLKTSRSSDVSRTSMNLTKSEDQLDKLQLSKIHTCHATTQPLLLPPGESSSWSSRSSMLDFDTSDGPKINSVKKESIVNALVGVRWEPQRTLTGMLGQLELRHSKHLIGPRKMLRAEETARNLEGVIGTLIRDNKLKADIPE